MSLTVFPPLLAELWEAMYHTFFSFSRLCWSFDLTWRSWNFKSFPINGRVSFSPLSIMVLAASNTYKEGNTIIRKGDILQSLIQSISDKRTAWCFMFSDICLDARTGHCWPNTQGKYAQGHRDWMVSLSASPPARQWTLCSGVRLSELCCIDTGRISSGMTDRSRSC